MSLLFGQACLTPQSPPHLLLVHVQIFALADILIFRFIIRISIAETAGWVGFVFLQVPIVAKRMLYAAVNMCQTRKSIVCDADRSICMCQVYPKLYITGTTGLSGLNRWGRSPAKLSSFQTFVWRYS